MAIFLQRATGEVESFEYVSPEATVRDLRNRLGVYFEYQGKSCDNPDTPLADLGIGPECTVHEKLQLPEPYTITSINGRIGCAYFHPHDTVRTVKETLAAIIEPEKTNDQQCHVDLKCSAAMDGTGRFDCGPLHLDDRFTRAAVFVPLANTTFELKDDSMMIGDLGIRGFWVGNLFPRWPEALTFSAFGKTLTPQEQQEVDAWTELHNVHNCHVNTYLTSEGDKVIHRLKVENIVMSPPPPPPRRKKRSSGNK